MPSIPIPIGAKPYYSIDPISKGITVADVCIDGHIDEAANLTRRIGLSQFADTLTGKHGQGCYYWEQLNKIVIVSGGKCFLMDSSGVLIDISGDVVFSSENIIFSAGNTLSGTPFLYMADGGYPVWTTGSDCTRLTAASGSPAYVSHVAWLSSRFLILEKNSRKFYATDTDPATGNISNTYFLSSDNPLTAESAPDNAVALMSSFDELYVFGTQSLEVWRDDGTFFSPIDGATSSVGCIASYSIVRADNTIFFLALVDGGTKRIVVKMAGRSPQSVSLPIEKIINSYATVDDAIGWLTNNSEYCLTFPSEGISWVYSYVSDTWTQWSHWNSLFAKREEFIGRYSAYAWGKLFMLSRVDGTIYEASREYFSDNGNIIRTEYISGWIDHGTSEDKRNLSLSFKIKTGSSNSYDEAPELMVRWRNNGSIEWRKEKLINLGLQGQREFIKKLFNLGLYNNRQYSFVMTDDSDLVISSLSEEAEKLR